jgi:Uma2 family endonuclease
MSALPLCSTNADDYLAQERLSTQKHEFVDGIIYAMAGASESHILVSGNIFGELRTQFKGRACKVYANDLRVNISATGDYVYPDVVALCGEACFSDKDNLLNPTVIVEVLSESTEAYDRGLKFERYRSIESLHDYVQVAQNRCHVEHYQRQANNLWLLREIHELTDILDFPSIQAHITVAEIYDKVALTPSNLTDI